MRKNLVKTLNRLAMPSQGGVNSHSKTIVVVSEEGVDSSSSSHEVGQHCEEFLMAKGQQKSNKESKKPKKDTSAPKTLTGEPMRAAVTTVVMPRGKEKNK